MRWDHLERTSGQGDVLPRRRARQAQGERMHRQFAVAILFVSIVVTLQTSDEASSRRHLPQRLLRTLRNNHTGLHQPPPTKPGRRSSLSPRKAQNKIGSKTSERSRRQSREGLSAALLIHPRPSREEGELPRDGPLAHARLSPVVPGLCTSGQYGLLLADFAGHSIRRLTPQSTLESLAGDAGLGSSGSGHTDGPADRARFKYPSSVALGHGWEGGSQGVIYVADSGNGRVRAIVPRMPSAWQQKGAGPLEVFSLPGRFQGLSNEQLEALAQWEDRANSREQVRHDDDNVDDGKLLFEQQRRSSNRRGQEAELGYEDGALINERRNDGEGPRKLGTTQQMHPPVLLDGGEERRLKRVKTFGDRFTAVVQSESLDPSEEEELKAARKSGAVMATQIAMDPFIDNQKGNGMLMERLDREIIPRRSTETESRAGTEDLQEVDTDDGVREYRLLKPWGIAVDPKGRILVTDRLGHSVSRLHNQLLLSPGITGEKRPFRDTIVDWQGSCFVGSRAGLSGYQDGLGSNSKFSSPASLLVAPHYYGGRGEREEEGGRKSHSWFAYVADTDNRAIRRISPSGEVTTLIGGPNQDLTGAEARDGPSSVATLSYPESLALGADGSLLISEAGAEPSSSIETRVTGRVRRVRPSGQVDSVQIPIQFQRISLAAMSTKGPVDETVENVESGKEEGVDLVHECLFVASSDWKTPSTLAIVFPSKFKTLYSAPGGSRGDLDLETAANHRGRFNDNALGGKQPPATMPGSETRMREDASALRNARYHDGGEEDGMNAFVEFGRRLSNHIATY